MIETNPTNEEYEDVNVENQKVQTDEDVIRCNVKVKRKFLKEYNALCKKKGMTRSKRLRNFMEFELKKDAEKVAAEEKAKLEKESEVIFDPFADNTKPKDLNTSVSEN